MVAYSAGFVAVFAILALFRRHALGQREELRLSTLDVFDARGGLRRHLLSVAIGVASILLALVVPMRLFWMPGFIYFLLGPVQAANRHRNGAARARLKASLVIRQMPAATCSAQA